MLRLLRTAQGTISIHALREEGDHFQRLANLFNFISIHALREEGDPDTRRMVRTLDDFNPRPPRGGRQEVSTV